MKRTIAALFLITSFLVIILPGNAVLAQDQVGFSVEAQLPENQINEAHSYFDLRMKPGQEQDIETVIYNNENEAITVKVSVYNASTNSNGLVVYEEQEEIDLSLEDPVTEIVTLEENEIVIPAGESVTAIASILMPDSSFDGMKLGGLHFEKVSEEDEEDQGVNIENKYAYVIGLQLSMNDEETEPELHLTSVEPGLANHRTAVVVNIQNSEPVLIRDLNIEAQIFAEDEPSPMKEFEQIDISMAPNSNMDVIIDWENQPLVEGNYRLELRAYDENNEWQWEENFPIGNEARTLNEAAVELETEDNNAVWYAIGAGVLVVIILILLVYIRKLKKGR